MRHHRLVGALMARTAEMGLTVHDLARRLDTAPNTPYMWTSGRRDPVVPLLARWAVVAERRLVVVDGDAVVAEGEEILPALPSLRRRQGLTQLAVAEKRMVSQSTIAHQEVARIRPYLVPTDEYVTAIGLRLALREAL